MALKNIKELINNKGYTINPNDRKIFEEGDLQTFFGFSEADAIEFIVYDVNDNQLPQLDNSLVRYVPLTTENIRDYFLIPEGTIFQKYQLPTEYFIDVERLLSEAGYTNGIFKTQITLINKRAGSEKQNDKMWISEISPSRTEVRLFPLKEGVSINAELKERFDIFVNGGEFREDTIPYVFEFLEQLKPNEVKSYLISKYSEAWLTELIVEFKISNIDTLMTTIYEKFIQASVYEFTNRISRISDINYGKPKQTKPNLKLSKENVFNICRRILTEVIQFYLPLQDKSSSTTTIQEFEESLDPVRDILQRSQSDTTIEPKQIELITKNISTPEIEESKLVLDRFIKNETKPLPTPPVIITPINTPPYEPVVKEEAIVTGGMTGAMQTRYVTYTNQAGELVTEEIRIENIK